MFATSWLDPQAFKLLKRKRKKNRTERKDRLKGIKRGGETLFLEGGKSEE